MKITNERPTFEEMLARISSLVPLLYQSTDRAAQQARAFFDGKQRIDPYLFPNLFRYFAKEQLDSGGQEVEDLGRDDLPNNGLLVRFNGLQLRILKAYNGSVPPPGDSEPKIAYYNQQLPLPLSSLIQTRGETRIEWNLIVLWDVSAEYLMRPLRLALPRSGRDNDVDVDWIATIPNPILSIQASPDQEAPPADDLDDISRRREDETGETEQD